MTVLPGTPLQPSVRLAEGVHPGQVLDLLPERGPGRPAGRLLRFSTIKV